MGVKCTKWLWLWVLAGVLIGAAGCHQDGSPSLPDDLEGKTSENAIQPIAPKTLASRQNPIHIDWAALDTGVAPIDPKDYAYPFAIDSEPVQNYAKEYNITPTQAQHSMMLVMAAPEALGKVLDQIQGHYLGHYFTDGEQVSLVIETTDKVVGSRYEYVFADKFGEGLLLPVVVQPKSPSAK